MSLEDRRLAVEQEEVHKEYLQFKTLSRRQKLFASWLLEELGLAEEQHKPYIAKWVELVLNPLNDGQIVLLALEELSKAGCEVDYDGIYQKLLECQKEAAEQIKHEVEHHSIFEKDVEEQRTRASLKEPTFSNEANFTDKLKNSGVVTGKQQQL